MDFLDYDLFHYLPLLYTEFALDYALSFYRRTINFVYYYYKFLYIIIYCKTSRPPDRRALSGPQVY